MIRWNWLAIIISGNSHMVSISNAVERESEKYVRERFRLLSLNWFSSGRLIRVTIRLYAMVLIQIIMFFYNQTRGMSMAVGMMIFNTVGDSSFVHGLHRMYLRP